MLFLQAVGQDLVENEAILEAVNQEALQLLEEIKNGDGLVDVNGFEAQLRLVNEKWNEAKVQVLMFVVKFLRRISSSVTKWYYISDPFSFLVLASSFPGQLI